jgi:hypothetical protein
MKTRNLAAAVLALGLSACAAEYAAVGIYAICAPPDPDGTTGACVYPATCDATFAGTPVLDVATAMLDFRLAFQLNNLLVDNSNAAAGRINTNDAYIQSFEITYAGASLEPWNVPAAITVPTAGSAGALVSLIPYQYFASIPAAGGAARTKLLVNVRAHGVLASQSSFTTAWFPVPVDVCSGCLDFVLCPDPATQLATCPSTLPGEASPGQSASYTCIATTAAARE